MKLTSITLTLFLVCILIFNSCKKDETNCMDASQYPFLEVGHQWVFYYGPSLFTLDEDTVTVTVENQMSDGNYMLSYSAQNNPILYSADGYYLACGDKLYGGGVPATDSDTWFLSTDLNVGDSWTRTTSSGSKTVEHTLLSKTETLNLPAGTFNNVWKFTYHQDGTFNTDTIFWRHDIGYVKYSGVIEYYLIGKNY